MELNASTPMESIKAEGAGLSDDTPVPTPEGWTLLGDIARGDRVFDPRGRICTVTEVDRQGVIPVYELKFDDGATLLAGGRQEWITISARHRERLRDGTRHLSLWATPTIFGTTTQDIELSLIHDAGGCIKANHSIPMGRPLLLPGRDLPIDPYLLGLWLGDGSSSQPIIYCHWEDEVHFFMRARVAGENWSVMRKKGNVLTCSLSRGSGTPFMTRLRQLGVLGHKYIPDQYLRASREQRMALMHGLMDSDGHIDDRGQAEYTSISEKLALGVLELALTLGQKATLHPGTATLNGKVVSDKYRILFAPTIRVMWLHRKAERLEAALRYREQAVLPRPRQRYIKSITPAGCRRTTQVGVDSPHHLILAGRSMVPTLARA